MKSDYPILKIYNIVNSNLALKTSQKRFSDILYSEILLNIHSRKQIRCIEVKKLPSISGKLHFLYIMQRLDQTFTCIETCYRY